MQSTEEKKEMAQITKGVMDMNMYEEVSPGTNDDDGEYFYSKEFV